MKTGTLDPVTNAETWTDTIELIDDVTGVAYNTGDITALTLKLRDPSSKETVLEGSVSDGDIVAVGAAADGTYRFTFSAGVMDGIDPKTYEVGLLASTSTVTKQLILGFLPVLEGL